jgi:hypothetical protein
MDAKSRIPHEALAAGCALLAAACALGNLGAMAAAVDFEIARLFALGALVDVDDRGERWLVVSMWIDAGYYLALLPVAFALAPGSSVGDVGRVAGSVYALVGAGGALALALKWPSMFDRFDAGDARAGDAFLALTDFVYRRVWNFVCAAAGALWWTSVALSARAHRPLFLASAALAVLSVLEGVTSIAHLHAFADLLLVPLLALLPIWSVLAAQVLVWRARTRS